MNIAIYARFSTALQKASSIEDQVRDCTARADREGWQVAAVFSDYAISGAVRERPGLNALLEFVTTGKATLVLAEAIDRISRDQEDLAGIYKRLAFHGVKIITLSEGTIDELQIGFKGTMASLFRKDLSDKIRRGQRGRIAAGRVTGNIVYGYRKVHRLDERGDAERGLREIDDDQAAIVRRIYAEYLAGDSPLMIARRLNSEGVPGPSGGAWGVSTISGDNVRGNGILCNPIYVGQLVYNRTRMVRDPATRRRVPRPNPPSEWVTEPVPHLAIVEQAEWDAVRERKKAWRGWSYASQKRPKRLLSGLIRCGLCGGPMTLFTASKWGCSNTRTKGTCTNRRLMSNSVLERRVISAVEHQLLAPDHVTAAIAEYHRERGKLARQSAADRARLQSAHDRLDRKIARLIDAIGETEEPIPELLDALSLARAKREALKNEIDEAEAERVVTLHPQILDAYRAAVAGLAARIDGPDAVSADARRLIRQLVDRITLTPEGNRGMTIDIMGSLSAALDHTRTKPQRSPIGTVPMVAEERVVLNRTFRSIRA